MQRMMLGLSALALTMVGTVGAAQDRPPAPQPETRAEAQTRAGRLFDRLDINHDGKLDQADRAGRSTEEFDAVDTNHDGMISRDEFAAAHAPRDSQGGDQGDRHMGHWGYDRRELDGVVMLTLHKADPGHTGTVTRDAFVAAALALFDQADTNHDGILTPEEHRAAAQAARAQMRAHDDGDMAPSEGN